jgi:hypothetical protein
MRYSSRIVATVALISIFNQHRLSATGPRSRPATKTDKEGNVGAETARLMITPTRPMAFLLQRMIIVTSGAVRRQVAGIGH